MPNKIYSLAFSIQILYAGRPGLLDTSKSKIYYKEVCIIFSVFHDNILDVKVRLLT